MASTKLAALAILALLQFSCALARHTHSPESCHGGKGHECKARGHGGSPPVSGRTPAVMTLNGFQKGEDGGGPAACDGRYHSDSEKVVALSTGWLRLDGTHRCQKMIRITSAHWRSVLAKVVDECDSARGCRDNIVDASRAVWKELGLDTKVGEVHVTWSDA